MDAALKPLPVLARILLSLIYVLAGIGKLENPGTTVAHMASTGIPFANVLVYGAIAVELGVGLMLMTGLFARAAAFVLFFYTLALALIFHAYWTMPAAAARAQHSEFFGHLAMMGGMLYVVSFGAGAFSLDALVGRARTAGARASMRNQQEMRT